MALQNALQHLASTAVNESDFPFLETPQGHSAAQTLSSAASSAQPPSAQATPTQNVTNSSTWPLQGDATQRQTDASNAHLPVPPQLSVSRSPGFQASVSPAISSSPVVNVPNSSNMALPHNPPTQQQPQQLPQSQPQPPPSHQQPPLQSQQHTQQLSSFPSLHQAEEGQAKKRGRPRKYFDEESRRAAEYLRRKRSKHDDDGSDFAGGLVRKEERRPYLHYQMDYGNYDSSKPDAMTARDIVVNWLATGTNFADWLDWPMEKRNEVAVQLRDELKSHGMLDRDSVSIKQQITFIQRGCEEAKKFEKEKMNEPLTAYNATKVSYLVNRGLTPGQAFIEHSWPFYAKLKDIVANVEVPMPISRPPRQPKPDISKLPARFTQQLTGALNGYDANTSNDFDTIDDALDPALTGVSLTEPSQSEVLAVTSWANQLLNQESQRRQAGASGSGMGRFPLAGMDDAEALKVLREKEKWELEKLQIRQKLELEKEQMKIKDKNAERDTHIQSILVFRDLLKDGLTKNQAGKIVFREHWAEIQQQMDADDD